MVKQSAEFGKCGDVPAQQAIMYPPDAATCSTQIVSLMS